MNMSAQPHIFFLLCDELRADTLGYMNHPVVRIPNIDELAKDAAIIHRAFAVCPMCAPSRTSMATGLYPQSHGVMDNGLKPVKGVESMYNTFRQHGYRTINYGKFHCNAPATTLGFDKSHEVFEDHGINALPGIGITCLLTIGR
jgi:arylsulfatase A-like enzyme